MPDASGAWKGSFGDESVELGMSLRSAGDMRIPADGFDMDAVLRKRCDLLGGITPPLHVRVIAAPVPVHGTTAGTVTGYEPLQEGHGLFPQCDALVTAVPAIALTVTAADCLPVFFFDPEQRVIGLAHAGWRGLTAHESDVLTETVRALVRLGAAAECVGVAIGPSVGPCHYAVDDERRALFAKRFGAEVVRGNAVDLRQAAVAALTRCGVPRSRIAAEPPCTACEATRFFSRRIDGKEPPEVGMAWIVMAG